MKGNGPINRWRRLTLGKKILLSYSVCFLTLLLIIFMFFQQALQENMLFLQAETAGLEFLPN